MQTSQPDADAVTLAYLTNPLYHHIFKQTQKAQQESIAADLHFYRKRIVALTKALSKGPSRGDIDADLSKETLEHIYNTYAMQLVHHFKVLDKKDIVQEQYPLEEPIETTSGTTFSLEDANDAMLKKVTTMPSLDNYVVSSAIEDNDGNTKFIPLHLEIDLSAPALKTKGVLPKRKKKKKEEEEESEHKTLAGIAAAQV